MIEFRESRSANPLRKDSTVVAMRDSASRARPATATHEPDSRPTIWTSRCHPPWKKAARSFAS